MTQMMERKDELLEMAKKAANFNFSLQVQVSS